MSPIVLVPKKKHVAAMMDNVSVIPFWASHETSWCSARGEDPGLEPEPEEKLGRRGLKKKEKKNSLQPGDNARTRQNQESGCTGRRHRAK